VLGAKVGERPEHAIGERLRHQLGAQPLARLPHPRAGDALHVDGVGRTWQDKSGSVRAPAPSSTARSTGSWPGQLDAHAVLAGRQHRRRGGSPNFGPGDLHAGAAAARDHEQLVAAASTRSPKWTAKATRRQRRERARPGQAAP
jgi:hypothetical protein